MQIDEAFADSQAPNAAAIKNARGVVIKKKLVGLFRSVDGTLIFGDCKGSGPENYRPSADFSDSSKPVYRCTCPSHQFPCKHSLALLYNKKIFSAAGITAAGAAGNPDHIRATGNGLDQFHFQARPL